MLDLLKKRESSLDKEFLRDGEARFLYAQMSFLDGHAQRASELLNDFLVLFPDHPRSIEAMSYLGELKEQNGEYSNALETYLQAYKKSEDNSKGIRIKEIGLRAYLQAGHLYLHLGKIKQARHVFTKIVMSGTKAKGSEIFSIIKIAQKELISLKKATSLN